MPQKETPAIPAADRTLLRDLAKRVAEIAAEDVQADRIALWTDHNSLRPTRPMMLIFPECGWRELLPYDQLICAHKTARWMELQLKQRIYTHEHFAADNVVEAIWIVRKVVRSSGWGLEPRRRDSSDSRGAWAFDPVVDSPADLEKLQIPRLDYDEQATEAGLAQAQDLFGDILDVQLRGPARQTYHLMKQWTQLRGLEEVMIDMFEQPAFLHEAMERLTVGHEQIRRQLVDMDLLDLNNDNTYQNSGGNGWTDDLPAEGFDGTVRCRDMWADAEAQELAQVGPAQHAEFSLAYEKRLLAPWGLTGYGCCEDLTAKLDDVLEIPNLRRISISPWADVATCAQKLRGDYIFSWKPRPMDLVGAFDEDRIAAYIRETIEVCTANNCRLEIILKDTHTCQNQPDRFDRWSRIARGQIERAG
jgi:hypothetical protein